MTDESIVVESYYQTGSTDGFGTYWKFPVRATQGQPPFSNATKEFAPPSLRQLTLFANFADVRPNHRENQVYNQTFVGNVTHPSAAPDNHLLTVWATPWDGQDQSVEVYDAGIYLLKSGLPINHPNKMLLVKNDPKYQELWPRALVPFKRIHGVDPPLLTHRNDGQASPHLPEGTPYGLVGTSSLYKRESYPNGVVPTGTVTAVSQSPHNRKQQWRELSISRFGKPGNWGEQGADAGLYENSDIWGVRILVMEPVSDVIHQQRRHFALGSNSEERLRILGEFPVRKFQGDEQPLDPDGNPDTSFLAKVPADVAWTFQTLDNNGMVLNMAQTWHQVRPGEVRHDCGGCHAHSQMPTSFSDTLAAKADYKVWDLANKTPLFALKTAAQDSKWDKQHRTAVMQTARPSHDVEFYRDIKPLLDRSCVACHSQQQDDPAGKLALDDYRPQNRRGLVPWAENISIPQEFPRTYARLVQYAWAYQSRRSPLIWKIYGRRLDGFNNDDIASPTLDYHDEKNVLEWCHQGKNKERDVDYTGDSMPPPEALAGTYKLPSDKKVHVPPLSDAEKLTLVRWIDLGCPIDRVAEGKHSAERQPGWLLDEGRPTLTLTLGEQDDPQQPVSRIRVGMHDYGTGLHSESFSVSADFPLDGAAAGENLASRFQLVHDGVWEWKLAKSLPQLPPGTLRVSIADKQGNVSRIERTIRATQKTK